MNTTLNKSHLWKVSSIANFRTLVDKLVGLLNNVIQDTSIPILKHTLYACYRHDHYL